MQPVIFDPEPILSLCRMFAFGLPTMAAAYLAFLYTPFYR
jgi:hypothetical protein